MYNHDISYNTMNITNERTAQIARCCNSVGLPLFLILSVCPHDKTETIETKISKLGTEIVHRESLPVN